MDHLAPAVPEALLEGEPAELAPGLIDGDALARGVSLENAHRRPAREYLEGLAAGPQLPSDEHQLDHQEAADQQAERGDPAGHGAAPGRRRARRVTQRR